MRNCVLLDPIKHANCKNLQWETDAYHTKNDQSWLQHLKFTIQTTMKKAKEHLKSKVSRTLTCIQDETLYIWYYVL
uniref:Uncharacterized protein n=1 Tax=Tanacetum cinerariifolium TaxID=118510 RepID=A0A6L2N382_TANCI|nr:hypothetical protein [Tanacetum cinerariifolium]